MALRALKPEGLVGVRHRRWIADSIRIEFLENQVTQTVAHVLAPHAGPCKTREGLEERFGLRCSFWLSQRSMPVRPGWIEMITPVGHELDVGR